MVQGAELIHLDFKIAKFDCQYIEYLMKFPTMGQMFKDQLGSQDEPESRDAMIKRYKSDL